MKNNKNILIILCLIMASCTNNTSFIQKDKSDKDITKKEKIIKNIIKKDWTIETINNNSWTINQEITKEKETLKKIINNTDIKINNKEIITTEKLLDDLSEDYDKEIEDEILKLFE